MSEIKTKTKRKDIKKLLKSGKQTPEICLNAVKQNGLCLEFVQEQTPEICLKAIKQNTDALKYVKNQTFELCMEAVKRDGAALYHVKIQTVEICEEAIKQDKSSIVFVDTSLFDFEIMLNKCILKECNSPIYYQDYQNNVIKYSVNGTDILKLISNQIKSQYGKIIKQKAFEFHNNNILKDIIKKDNTFPEGLFFIKLDDNSYEIYKKTTEYKDNGWIMSNVIQKINIIPIGKYGILKEMN